MYLNDLLDTLNRGEKPDLSKSELRQIFQKEKPLNDSQRLDLFHRLCLRNQGGIKPNTTRGSRDHGSRS